MQQVSTGKTFAQDQDSDSCCCNACKEKDMDQMWEKVTKWTKVAHSERSSKAAGKRPLCPVSLVQGDPIIDHHPFLVNPLSQTLGTPASIPLSLAPHPNSYPHPTIIQPSLQPTFSEQIFTPPKNFLTHTTKTSQKTFRDNRKRNQFDPIPLSYGELYPRLLQGKLVVPQHPQPLKPPYPKGYDANVNCEYHAGVRGHSIENCIAFKRKVQHLINLNILQFETKAGQGNV